MPRNKRRYCLIKLGLLMDGLQHKAYESSCRPAALFAQLLRPLLQLPTASELDSTACRFKPPLQHCCTLTMCLAYIAVLKLLFSSPNADTHATSPGKGATQGL